MQRPPRIVPRQRLVRVDGPGVERAAQHRAGDRSALAGLQQPKVLDGGHAAIAVYERLRSRRGRRYHADVAKLLPLTSAVVVFLVVFGVAVIYLDIVRPISIQ